MKKLFFLLSVCLMCVQAMAMPAVRKPAHLLTTDDVTVRLHGDEFFNYYTTDDGYTVLRNQHGQWEYARQQNGGLVSTGVAAHNAGNRSASELQLLASVGKNVVDEARVAQALQIRQKVRQEAQQRASQFDYKRFRGLIILVEYTDLSFEMDNPQDFYNHMVNDENYTGYTLNGKKVNCPGSMRDYYRDQSNGLFDPVFDVVGPVKVSYSSTDHRQTSNTASIFLSAMKSLNSQVDYSKYDGDGDGNIDLAFFIGAGPASSYEGNNSNLLWPHQSTFGISALFTRLDGKKPSSYACCTEIYGWQDNPSSMETQGIGVMCHEFSHVLGLSDHYDTDYSSSGGECLTIGEWDIMDAGGSNNVARTPAAYTLYERWALGWCNPTVISQPGTYTLNAIDGTSDGYILRSPNKNEYFTLENRQKTTRWDRHVPGHGMLITRIDSSDASSWTSNKVNVNPSHLHLELLRAWPDVTSTGLDSDPFPGTHHVTSINNTTTPNLVTWSGKKNPYYITRIQEKRGVISFYVAAEGSETKFVETFEKMPLGLEEGTEAQGDFSIWAAHNATIASNAQSKKVAMKSLSAVYMTQPMYYDMYQVDVEITNPSATAKFSLYYSFDWGENWTLLPASSGDVSVTVAANSSEKPVWFVDFDNSQPVCYLLAMIAGSETDPVYIDNFTVYYTGEEGIHEPSNRKLIETFDRLPISLASDSVADGDIAKWKTGNATVADYGDSHQVEMTNPSVIEMASPLYYNMLQVTAEVSNPQPSVAMLQLFYSLDDGDTWTAFSTIDGDEQLEVGANSDVKGRWNVDFANDQPVRYRLAMVGGEQNAPCYVDNFTIFYTGEPGHTDYLLGDLNGDGYVDVTDVSLMIDVVLGKDVSLVPGVVTDLSGDGNTDVTDVSILIDIVLGKS